VRRFPLRRIKDKVRRWLQALHRATSRGEPLVFDVTRLNDAETDTALRLYRSDRWAKVRRHVFIERQLWKRKRRRDPHLRRPRTAPFVLLGSGSGEPAKARDHICRLSRRWTARSRTRA
jgi:hypothetical protein